MEKHYPKSKKVSIPEANSDKYKYEVPLAPSEAKGDGYMLYTDKDKKHMKELKK